MKLQETIQKLLNNKQNKKYLLVFLLCGIFLMLLPSPQYEDETESYELDPAFSVEKEEARLAQIISSIKGVHSCEVLLSVRTGTETVLAENEEGAILVSKGNQEETITVLERYPGYQGAIIVIGGHSDANVRYDVLSAVMSYTGLDNDKISICPMEE